MEFEYELLIAVVEMTIMMILKMFAVAVDEAEMDREQMELEELVGEKYGILMDLSMKTFRNFFFLQSLHLCS